MAGLAANAKAVGVAMSNNTGNDRLCLTSLHQHTLKEIP